MPEGIPAGFREAAPENRTQVAPDNPEAKSAKPMNEASDQELLVFMRDVLAAEALLEWVQAVERVKRTLASPVREVVVMGQDNKPVMEPVLGANNLPVLENGQPKMQPKKATIRLNPQELEDALALAWHDALNKLDSIELVVDHMKFRANSLRCKGILGGDPRERKVLEINEP